MAGLPPRAVMVSGTALLLRRSYTMELPGSSFRKCAASHAVRWSQPQISPASSTSMQRSASPSKQAPTAAPCCLVPSCVGTMFSGTSGLGSWAQSSVQLSLTVMTSSLSTPLKTFSNSAMPQPLLASTNSFMGFFSSPMNERM